MYEKARGREQLMEREEPELFATFLANAISLLREPQLPPFYVNGLPATNKRQQARLQAHIYEKRSRCCVRLAKQCIGKQNIESVKRDNLITISFCLYDQK